MGATPILAGLALIALAGLPTMTRGKKCALPVAEERMARLGVEAKTEVLEEGLGVFQTTMLPMRDGVKLHTVVVSPPFSSQKQWPTVIDRSPYGMFNTELLADLFLLFDFVAVSQDMRGTCMSEGNFTVFHSDTNDGVDTVDWITSQPWSDGRVYEIGGSADGIAGLELAKAAPAALKAQFIIWATAEARLTFFPGGTYRQGLIEGWLKGTVPKQATELIAETKTHEAPGAWWDAVEIKGGQFEKIKWPTVFWAGWYDIFQHGNLYTFDGFQKRSDPSVAGDHYIVVDPLGHCQSGAAYFPKHLIAGRALLPILLGIQLFKDGKISKAPEGVDHVTFYVMGAKDAPKGSGNYWTSLPDWPEYSARRLYLAAGGNLSFAAPAGADEVSAPSTATSWKYDPTDPTPTIGGNNLLMKCGPLDQRPAEARDDVAVFTSPVLSKPLAVTGPLTAEIYVSTANANDTDFAVRLTDVYPDGTSQLIQDGIERMRWRISPSQSKPVPMEAGKVYPIRISLWNTSYVFPAGHRIRATVSSANYPRFSPNPNTGLPLDSGSTATIVAENSVHHSSTYPSSIILPYVELSQLPEHGVLESAHTLARKMATSIKSTRAARAFEDIIAKMAEL